SAHGAGISKVEEYTPTVTSVEDPFGEQNNPTEFVLYQNYPNPFNPATTIVYSIPERDFVTLKVYDLCGRELQTLVSEFVNLGPHSVNFDASNFANGLYFYKLHVGDLVETRKMLLIR
ncbi:MAG: T9SS type A sorting domain-containing protein, partial [Planctomycetota bacterium]